MIDLDALEALEKAATERPWKAHTETFKFWRNGLDAFDKAHSRGVTPNVSYVWKETEDGERDVFTMLTGNGPTSPQNAALIAALRNSAAALLAEVRAAREWLTEIDHDGRPYSSKKEMQLRDAYRTLVAANSGGEG